MSTFSYLLLCISPLLIKNVSSQYIRKRGIFDPALGAPGISFPPSLMSPYPDMGIPPFADPFFAGPGPCFPEPYAPMIVPEFPGPAYGCGPCSYAPVGWPGPGCAIPTPICDGFCDYGVEAEIIEEVCEVPVVTEVPVITTVGFGGDALALALSPLLEAADADVALLMFTKVRSI